MGVVALMIQDRTGFEAGYVQLIFDALIFSVALLLFAIAVAVYSLAGQSC